jgi:hypothetical protein
MSNSYIFSSLYKSDLTVPGLQLNKVTFVLTQLVPAAPTRSSHLPKPFESAAGAHHVVQHKQHTSHITLAGAGLQGSNYIIKLTLVFVLF